MPTLPELAMSQMDTKKRLLDAAEQLFAEHGIGGTSLRDITARADANLASVNYHFGGKEGLLEAVFERRVAPVNRRRVLLLEAFEAEAGEAPVAVEKIVWAFLAPPFQKMREWGDGGINFMRIVGRMHSDPTRWSDFFRRQFEPLTERFEEALREALPELPEDELVRRMHYLVGAMAHTFCWGAKVCPVGPKDGIRPDLVVSSLVRFAAAGLAAPREALDIEVPAAAATEESE